MDELWRKSACDLAGLIAGGRVMIEGVVSARGIASTNSRAGGGAGGSIWITAGVITGAGIIRANGGNGQDNGWNNYAGGGSSVPMR